MGRTLAGSQFLFLLSSSLTTKFTVKKSEPVPISRQEPLFDHEAQGEIALHYLETTTPFGLAQVILPTLFILVFCEFCEVIQHSSTFAASTELALRLKGVHDALLTFNWVDLRPESLHKLLSDFRKLEGDLAIANAIASHLVNLFFLHRPYLSSFRFKRQIPEDVDVLDAYFSLGRISLHHAQIKARANLHRYFVNLKPTQQEYLFQTLCPRPLGTSRPLLHRMYSSYTPNQFRAVTMLSNSI